ncbi:hypothetical protein BC830DRAFT_1171524 [Chytriomyces sp. MP71]|nr:hypothetical protein BC830DRAFT_1171524 [Chytriomyces sp. MP71]
MLSPVSSERSFTMGFNTKSMTWEALGAQLFGPGMKYEWAFPKIGFNLVNTCIICNLTVGINSSIVARIVLAFIFQYYLRKHRSEWVNR